MAKKKVKLMTLLALVAFGENGTVAKLEEVQKLVDDGLAEIGPVAEDGSVPVRATAAGVEAAAPKAPAVAAPAFTIDDNIPVPTVSGRGRSASTYPFDSLEIGQSFFVANTAEKPNIAKSLASTVSGATARHSIPDPSGAHKLNRNGESVPVMLVQRKFIVRSAAAGTDPADTANVGGARIWRVAL